MIVQTPGDKTHLIFNPFSGVFLSVFPNTLPLPMQEDFHVKGGPVGIMPWWQRWSLKQQ